MSEFNFNHSRIDEKYQIFLSNELIYSIRAQARILLIPFFREVTIRHEISENEKKYPVLTTLAEGIVESVFETGEVDYESAEEASDIGLKFLSSLNNWQKICLGFYFSSDETFFDQIDKANEEDDEDSKLTLEQMYQQDGIKAQKKANELAQNDRMMASYLVNELVHLQDIFSTEDISDWDASSIVNANLNFEEYAGNGHVLIPVKLDEFDYWEKLIGNDDDVE